MQESFEFTYTLDPQASENEVLNAVAKSRIREPEPKSYFFTESGVSPQGGATGAYGPDGSTSPDKFNITTQLNLTNKKAYAVTSGQVLIVPQTGSTDKVNVFIKPLKNVDIGIPIKYFVYRGLKKVHFLNSLNNNILVKDTTNTPFMAKVWNDLIHFNNLVDPLPEIPAGIFGYSTSESGTNSLDAKFFNVVDEISTDENNDYNLPIIEAGQYFGDFSDEGGFEIVLNDGFYHQDKSDTGFDFNLDYARATKITLDMADIADNPDISEKIYRENVQNFLDPAAFYGAHITEKEKGEIKVVDNNAKYSTKEDIYNNIVSKFYNKHKCYVYIQCNRGRSFNFDGTFGDEPLKIGTAENTMPGLYQTYGWPIIITETEQTYTDDAAESEKSANTLSLQLKFKTVNKDVTLYNAYGNCANETIEGNFLASAALVDDANIDTQEYTNSVNYKLVNNYNGTSLVTKNIASFIYINHEEKEVEYFNDFFGPINLTPIAKPVLSSSDNTVQKIAQKKKKIKVLIDNLFAFESNFFSTGTILLDEVEIPVDNRTRLYVLRKIDASEKRSDKTELSQYLSTTRDYALADTADQYFEFIFGNKNNRIWKGSFNDASTGETVRSLQLVNLVDQSYSEKFTQLGITETEFNKVIYNDFDVNPTSGHLPSDATNIYFHLDETDVEQSTVYKKYKLGVKYDTAGVLFGINTDTVYPTSPNEVYVYTVDGNFFFTRAYANKCNYFEEFANVAVNFRPLSTYDGEFGFDWLRIGDVVEPSYESSIVSGYEKWDGSNYEYDSPTEAYAALKKEYINIKTNIPDKGDDEIDHLMYYVPYLNIYPTNAVGTPAPPSSVDLRAIITGYEDVTLKYEYDTSLFKVTPKNDEMGSPYINITCLQEFGKDQIIKVVASSQNPGEPVQNKVAGLIKICKNSRGLNRKNLKVALVKVKTNIENTAGNEKTGAFLSEEKKYLSKALYQAFVYADIEEIELSLAGGPEDDPEFRIGGTYIDSNKEIKWYEKDIYIHLKEKMIHKDPKFKNYFLCFSFDVKSGQKPVTGGAVNGRAEGIGKQSVILYKQKEPTTLVHETLHGLGLYHTHKDEDSVTKEPTMPIGKWPDDKFVYRHGDHLDNLTPPESVFKATDNFMSYNRIKRNSTWKWQWEIVQRNIQEYIYS